MNFVMPSPYCLHLFVSDLLARVIFMGVQFRFYFQTGSGSRGTYEIDDRFVTYQPFPSPSDADLGKRPVSILFHLLVPGK